MQQRHVRCRALAVAAGLVLLSSPVLQLTVPLLRPGRLTLEAGLSTALAWVLLACWAWLALSTAMIAVEAAVTGRVEPRGRGGLVRGLVATACGVTVAAGIAGPSYADTQVPLPHAVTLLDGLPLPDRVAGGPGESPPASVVVRRGDTLSGLALTHDLTWPALYAANRDRIGDDPDLILPGMHLALPTRDGDSS